MCTGEPCLSLVTREKQVPAASVTNTHLHPKPSGSQVTRKTAPSSCTALSGYVRTSPLCQASKQVTEAARDRATSRRTVRCPARRGRRPGQHRTARPPAVSRTWRARARSGTRRLQPAPGMMRPQVEMGQAPPSPGTQCRLRLPGGPTAHCVIPFHEAKGRHGAGARLTWSLVSLPPTWSVAERPFLHLRVQGHASPPSCAVAHSARASGKPRAGSVPGGASPD